MSDIAAGMDIGVLECFYGRLWAEEDRHRLIRTVADAGAKLYVYGPADDGRTGSSWRRPWTPEERAETARLGALAEEVGIELVWRVSPMSPKTPENGIRFDSEEEVALLAERLREAREAGASKALVAFDDVSRSPDSPDLIEFRDTEYPLAAAQAHLVNRLIDALDGEGLEIIACPTEYWGMDASTYRATLHGMLAPDIPVCWTGPSIISGTITDDDVSTIGGVFSGRALWLWDNFPVNDWGAPAISSPEPALTPHLVIGALADRSPSVRSRFAAHLVNASSSPALTAITFAALAAESEGGEAGIDLALRSLVGSEEAGVLRELLGPFTPSPVSIRSFASAERASWQALAALDAPGGTESAEEALTSLRGELAALQESYDAAVAAPEGSFSHWLLSSESHWFASLADAVRSADSGAIALLARLRGERETEAATSSQLLAVTPEAHRILASQYPWAYAIVLRALRLGSAQSPDFPPKG